MSGYTTFDEFLALCGGDPPSAELVDGTIVAMGEPRFAQVAVRALLIAATREWQLREPHRDPVAGTGHVHLGPYDAYGPDLAICRSQPRLDERGFFVETPMICVEIRPPETRCDHIGHKKRAYEAHGVRELWLVDDVTRAVIVFRRSAPDVESYDTVLELEAGDMLSSPLLPGFGIGLWELFVG